MGEMCSLQVTDLYSSPEYLIWYFLGIRQRVFNPTTLKNLNLMLQIRRGKKDNLGIIFHITPLKGYVVTFRTISVRGHNIFFC